MLATFSLKMERPCGTLPSFLLGLCFFNFLTSWPPLGAIWFRFWKVWGSILEVFQDGFGSILQVFQKGVGSILEVFQKGLGLNFGEFGRVLDGLVGLREALRII